MLGKTLIVAAGLTSVGRSGPVVVSGREHAVTVQLVITGDPQTGMVKVQGAGDNMLLAHWLLGEARRLIERAANERDVAAKNGKPHLVIAHELPPSTPA